MTERNTHFKDGELLPFKVAASTKTEAGKLVGVNSAGYAVEGGDTAGIKILGVADETVDNSSGANGDKTVRVRKGKVFKLKNSGTNAVDVADVGSNVFVEDDETVADDPGTNGIVAGRCMEVVSDGVWLEIPAPPVVANQADSEASTVAALVTDFNALLAKIKAAGYMANA